MAVLSAWLDAGVRLVQLRAKALTLGPMLELAESVRAGCAAAGATFIVNDRVDVARLSDADGVHLGQEDLSPAQALPILKAGAIVGLSTHSASQVRDGLLTSATYLAIGPAFPTTTKANPDLAVGLDGVAAAAALVRAGTAPRPLVAIGGITIAHAPAVISAGADSVAVVSGLLDGEPGRQARAFLNALA